MFPVQSEAEPLRAVYKPVLAYILHNMNPVNLSYIVEWMHYL